ncbi:hypothetical protein ACJZ2D_015828 [Fusarium nematophilum]
MERLPRQRRRPALSCIECRRRKIKCDRAEPCSHCVAARLQCAYRFYRQAGGVAAQLPLSPSTEGCSPVAAAQQRIAPGESGLSLPVVPREPVVVNQLGTSTSSLGRRNVTHPQSNTQPSEIDLGDLSTRVKKLEESASCTPTQAQGLAETGRNILARQSGLQDSQIVLNKTRILRWSHWMGTAPEFEPIHACYTEATGDSDAPSTQDPYTKAEISQVGHLLQKCKEAARIIKAARPGNGPPCSDAGHNPLAREHADEMVSLYLRTFELAYRVFHIPSFWVEYQRYWNDPDNSPTDLRLKVLLVIGIGSSIYSHGDAGFAIREKVHQWIHAAQMWLSGPLKKDRLDVSGLQIYCLAILARQVFSIGGDLAWVSVGSLVHRAMQVGLHRDPKHLPPMSLIQAELRRRLWVTILEMVVQSSLDTAMPPRISFDEFDTEPPSNINDDELSEATAVVQPHPKSAYTQMSMQLLLLDSLPTRLRILQLLSGLRSELSYTDALALSSKIDDACRSYNMFLRNNESSTTPFHRNLLEYLVRRFMIPLHCPFASRARSNPLFHYSLKVSLDAAMAIISPESDDSFAQLMSINSGLLREGLRYAFTTITFELIQQTEAQRLDGTLRRHSQHRDALKKTVRDMMDLSVVRIRQGETNIKSHMFLNMILALVQAKEDDVPHELRVATSARESLELCYEILQLQVASISEAGVDDLGLGSTNFHEHGGSALDFDLDFFLSGTDFY